MLDKPKGLTMAEMQEIVIAGAMLAEAVETNLDHSHAGIMKLVKQIKEGHGERMVGALLAGELVGEAHAIAGMVGEVQKRFFLLHKRLTDIATEKGADVPAPRSGGDR